MTPIRPSLADPYPQCVICPDDAIFDREGVPLCALCADLVDFGRVPVTKPLVPLFSSHEAALWGWIAAISVLIAFSCVLFLALTASMAVQP